MISVVIPAYGVQSYLPDALRSVREQIGVDIETVVVDKGGLASARNLGIDAAKGEWIAFLDSDDMLLPGALESLLNAARETGCDIVAGRLLRGRNFPKNFCQNVDISVLDANDAVARTLYQTDRLEPSACGKLFRRDVFEKERFREGVWYEDLDFFYRAYFRARKVAVVDRDVYFYRENPAGFLSKYSVGRLDVLEVTARMERYMAQVAPELLPAVRDRRLSANFNILGLLLNNPDADEAEIRIAECMSLIHNYRAESLRNPRVRLKNKIGILASYLGDRWLKGLLRHKYMIRPRVVTLDEGMFAERCGELGQMVAANGFNPDVIVGIRNGGEYVANVLADSFPDARILCVELRRCGSSKKERFRPLFKILPLWILDRLRIIEWHLLARKKIATNVRLDLPAELQGLGHQRILVVDDAVDSGLTLSSVVGAINGASNTADIRSAVITVTTESPMIRPDYTLYDNKILIRFPWSADWK